MPHLKIKQMIALCSSLALANMFFTKLKKIKIDEYFNTKGTMTIVINKFIKTHPFLENYNITNFKTSHYTHNHRLISFKLKHKENPNQELGILDGQILFEMTNYGEYINSCNKLDEIAFSKSEILKQEDFPLTNSFFPVDIQIDKTNILNLGMHLNTTEKMKNSHKIGILRSCVVYYGRFNKNYIRIYPELAPEKVFENKKQEEEEDNIVKPVNENTKLSQFAKLATLNKEDKVKEIPTSLSLNNFSIDYSEFTKTKNLISDIFAINNDKYKEKKIKYSEFYKFIIFPFRIFEKNLCYLSDAKYYNTPEVKLEDYYLTNNRFYSSQDNLNEIGNYLYKNLEKRDEYSILKRERISKYSFYGISSISSNSILDFLSFTDFYLFGLLALFLKIFIIKKSTKFNFYKERFLIRDGVQDEILSRVSKMNGVDSVISIYHYKKPSFLIGPSRNLIYFNFIVTKKNEIEGKLYSAAYNLKSDVLTFHNMSKNTIL